MAALTDPFKEAAIDSVRPDRHGAISVRVIDGRTGEQEGVFTFSDAQSFADEIAKINFGSPYAYYDLRNMDFRGVTFYGAKGLTKARFDGSNLEGASFEKSGLEKASFRNCNLKRTNYSHALLRRVDFTDSDMQGAVLFAADAKRANFSGVNLSNASLRSMDAEGGNFFNADLSNAETHMLNLRLAHLEFTKITAGQKEKAMFAEQTTHQTVCDILKKRGKRCPAPRA